MDFKSELEALRQKYFPKANKPDGKKTSVNAADKEQIVPGARPDNIAHGKRPDGI